MPGFLLRLPARPTRVRLQVAARAASSRTRAAASRSSSHRSCSFS
ncbi:hypothetical protein ACFC58_42795 [Kitasatospora purpeofusca]